MDSIRRAPIDDYIDNLDLELAGAVRASAALRRSAVALDQVVSRANDDIRRWDRIEPETLASFEGDFAHVRKQLETLETSARVGRAMLAAIETQVKPAPSDPDPDPKQPKGRK